MLGADVLRVLSYMTAMMARRAIHVMLRGCRLKIQTVYESPKASRHPSLLLLALPCSTRTVDLDLRYVRRGVGKHAMSSGSSWSSCGFRVVYSAIARKTCRLFGNWPFLQPLRPALDEQMSLQPFPPSAISNTAETASANMRLGDFGADSRMRLETERLYFPL